MTETNGAVRVRFAPSPTGYLHVGGARTAVFNWLYARHTGGRFVVRIEDTDAERSTRESEASLLEDLRWLGLDWDEGPEKGGPHAPYRQSERMPLYRTAADALVERGLAYPCFCSDAELAAKKEAAVAAGRATHYDGTCRGLSSEDVERTRREGTPEVVRFKVRDGSVRFEDAVRGTVEMETDMVGDFVILRSNGLPTYNFAAAYDDAAMEITHVLRGEEHLPNTLRQILVYEALEQPLPVFGHVPLILAEDRSKLSKRHGASSVEELRARGFLPEAVVNYLVLLGWSHPDEEEKLSQAQLIDAFSIERINRSAAVFDPKKLAWMNGLYIRELDPDALFTTARPFLPERITSRFDEAAQREIVALLGQRLETLGDIETASRIFDGTVTPDDEAVDCVRQSESKDVLAALAGALADSDESLTADGFKAMIKQVGTDTGHKGKALYFPVRAALTGSVHGPDLGQVAAIRGREAVAGLLQAALEW